MEAFLAAHIGRLKAARDELERLARIAKQQKVEFAMRFNLSLLPDIIACLKAWRGKTKSRHWPAWMWRVVFCTVEECEKYLVNHSAEPPARIL